MPTPLRNRAFLSVAGEDVAAARRLASAFTPNLIYLYEQSGQHAADLWAEESAALRDSSVVVIFWSKSYLKKKGTLREIALIAELLDKRVLGHPLIVRLDDTALSAVAESPGDPLHGQPVLAPLTERWRALPIPYESHQVEHSLEQLLIDNGLGKQPDHDRSTLIQSLTQAVSISLRQIRPIVWVFGHEGYGRRFLIDRFMRTFDPNSRRLEIPLSDADGPLQALLRVLSSGLRATEAELTAVAKRATAAYGGQAEVTQLTECVQKITASGQHLVFRLEPIHTDASGWIPKWMIDWFSEVPTTSRPLVFVAAQFAYPAGLLNGSSGASKIASFAVPSLTFEEAKSYAVRLTSIFDKSPDRWTEPDIDGVVDAAAGTIALLISIARERCQLADLRLAPPPLLSDDHPFTQKLNAHLNVCVDLLKQMPDALELLATLVDLVLVSYDDLRTLFPKAELPSVLGRCFELGLIESPADGQYQVPRLVHRRLYSYLLSVQGLATESITRAKRVLRLMADRSQPIEGGDVFQRIETRIRSSLSVSGEVPDGRFEPFISASYLFHAAIRAYDRQLYDQALKLLRLCIRSIDNFPELNTKCVVLRYYGLAAARQGEEDDKLRAVDLLRKAAPLPRPRGLRVNPVSDADFVLGFADRLVERWDEAIRHFRTSLTRLEEEGNWRVSDCHRELADCFLNTRPPQYADARFHAQKAYESRDNFMSLDIYVKSLVQSCWNDTSLTERQKAELETKLEALYARLEATSTALSNGVWHQRKAEDIAESGDEADLREAVAHARKAMDLSRREDFHPLLWKLLLRLGSEEALQESIERTKKATSNDHLNKRTRSVAARYLVAAHVARGEIEAARQVFDRFRNGFPRSVSDELRDAIRQRSLDGTEFAYRR
jgi:tetratricopeptide (TPR) repeat protein